MVIFQFRFVIRKVILRKYGCSDTSNCVSVTKVGLNEPSGLKRFIDVYPSPTKDIFHFNLSSNLPIDGNQISIRSATGELVFNERISSHINSFYIGYLNDSIYFLKYEETIWKLVIIK